MALRVDSRDAGARLPRTYRFGLTAASALALAAFAPQALAQDAPGADAAVTDEDGGRQEDEEAGERLQEVAHPHIRRMAQGIGAGDEQQRRDAIARQKCIEDRRAA